MKLYHATPQYNVGSILAHGIDNRRAFFNGTVKMSKFLDSNATAENKQLKINKAIFLLLPDDLQKFKKANENCSYFEVDSSKLKSDWLSVCSNTVADYVLHYLNKSDKETAEAWADIYWKTGVPFEYFNSNKDAYYEKFQREIGIPFIGEVLYFQPHIDPKAIRLVKEENCEGR